MGIVHTNSEAYARQYGVGASLIPALSVTAMLALTIRTHYNQVIKLSDALPSFAPGEEGTCNVKGVRSEFLEGVDLNVLSSLLGACGHDAKGGGVYDGEAPSLVYFIGKLVWAKGFNLMLELQDIFQKRNNWEYFHIDVYGGDLDKKANARAFHRRSHLSPTKRPIPPPPSTNKDAISNALSSHPSAQELKDLNAAAVLTNPQSIKAQSSRVIEQMKQHHRPS